MKCLSIRTQVGVIIAIFMVAWFCILYWALKNDALPHLFANKVQIFSHIASAVEYRAAHFLTYHPMVISDIKEPEYFKLGDLLSAWNPDDTSPQRWLQSAAHPSKGQNVARFDYSDEKQRSFALEFRKEEIPFIVYNVPELEKAITETFTPNKLLANIGNNDISVERIRSNNYLYYHNKRKKSVQKQFPDWEPPQEDVIMTYPQFLEEVRIADGRADYVNSSIPLYYFTINADEGYRTKWIADSLPFFSPQKSFFMVDVSDFKGINCRFGMKGVAAASHYDGRRNFIAMLRGRKRYVIQPPRECSKLELYPRNHPSGRHSRIDWSDIQQIKQFPKMYNSLATEVMLSMGEMLYLPGNWFHYIVSQDASIQCNSRSGSSNSPRSDLGNC